MEDKQVERAVVRRNRASAIKSFFGFHRKELTRLAAEKRLLKEELARTRDPAKRAELAAALRENRLERIKHDLGFRRSSFRQNIKTEIASAKSVGDAIEQRQLSLIHPKEMSPSPADTSDVRADDDSDTPNKLTGYAAIFNKESVDLGWFVEQIAPGAFSDAIKKSDVRLLTNHESNEIFARTKSKTLRLYEDIIGLKFYADLLPDDPASQALARRIERGDWSQMSFSFTVEEDKWQYAKKPGDKTLRTILKIKELFDISVVTYPAYPDTIVTTYSEQKSVEAAEQENELQRQQIAKNHKARQRQIDAGMRKLARIQGRLKAKLPRRIKVA